MKNIISSPKASAEFILRIGMGIFLFFAGVGKIMGGIPNFVESMSAGFAESILPMFLVIPMLYIIPVLEVLLGLLLLSGYKKNLALLGTGILLIIFLFGHLMQGQMQAIQGIFIYLIAVAFTLHMGEKK